MKTTNNEAAKRTGADVDAALAAAAQGVAPTSDDAAALPDDGEERREVDVIGAAAGVELVEGEVLGGPDKIDKRDAHRWELDPASAEDPASGAR